ncbi:nuclear transport factor 2 family protein [Alcanivorax sp.]|jgi:hypothetical protein|uniref:nuclear transport factor 2 family protein n=1 Tax=Alcanivorax sp. TaxID=1872427 RepID=UPI0032D8CBC5
MREVLSKRRGPAYLLLILLQGLLAACDSSAPEQAISEALAEIEQGIEDGDTSAIMDRLTDNIAVQRRGQTLNRKEIHRTLVGLFFRYPNRNITFTGINIALDPVTLKQARVQFTALAWGGKNVLPEDADSYQVDSHWQLKNDWEIDSLTANGLRE